MKKICILTALLYASLGYAQNHKTAQGKGEKTPTQESIFQLRKEADAAFALSIQSIVPDTCRSSSSGKMFVITGRILRKYFDKTGKFKEQKITYLSGDTAVYSGAPHVIVFFNHTDPLPAEKCAAVHWTSRPGTAFIFSTKTEAFIAKKKE
jgi:hypothetical protein